MEKFKIEINDPVKAWEISKETGRLFMEGLEKEEALRKAIRQYQPSPKSNKE